MNKEAVRQYTINKFGVLLGSFVFAQAQHESANFTSNLAITHNNIFGWTYSNKLSKYATRGDAYFVDTQGIRRYYAKFNSIKNCIDWHYEYIKARPRIASSKNVSEFASALKSYNYFEDNLLNYTRGLAKWLKSGSNGLLVTLLPIAFAVWYLLNK